MNLITLGTFDLTHYGHIEFLNKCSNISGDMYLSVSIFGNIKVSKTKPLTLRNIYLSKESIK